MANKELLKILKQGVDAWNAWAQENRGEPPDFRRANLEGTNLAEADLRKANLEGANLAQANLPEVDLRKASLEGANLAQINLREANLEGANLSGANLKGANLSGANLSGAGLQGASLEMATLQEAVLQRANLEGANLRDADLTGAKLKKAYVKWAVLEGASLRGADINGANLRFAHLEGVSLHGANLETADLTAVRVNNFTTLESANVEGCIVDRHTIDSLKDNGGLTRGELARLNMRDNVADLRLSFSGLRLWLHLFALGTFLFPYLAFIVRHYFEARFFGHSEAETIPLWMAIGRYIWNGGQNWQNGWDFHWSFVTFMALGFYNICRWLLLSKTIELEHRQEVSGIRVPFVLELEPFWSALVASMRWMFWIGLIVLALNTAHFLTQEIPISPQR